MRTLSVTLILALAAYSACAMPHGHAAARQPDDVDLCYVQGGALVHVRGRIDPASGDTMLFDRALQAVYQDPESPFTIRKAWFTSHRPIEHSGRTYFKNFPPRKFRIGELSVIGEFDHAPLLIEAGAPNVDPSIIYVLVSADCLFQAYFYTT